MHPLEWSDINRMVAAMEPPRCTSIPALNAAARLIGKLIDGFLACPDAVRNGLLAGLLLRIGRDLVIQILGLERLGEPVKDPKAGGAGTTRDFSREKDEKKSDGEIDRRLPPDVIIRR
jgi:hypothetical protein